MRSVAEALTLSSVVSSIEGKPDCSNKGASELKQDSHQKALQEVSLTAEGKWRSSVLSVSSAKSKNISSFLGLVSPSLSTVSYFPSFFNSISLCLGLNAPSSAVKLKKR